MENQTFTGSDDPETERDRTVEAILDAISSSDRTVEIRPPRDESGTGLMRMLVLVAAAAGLAYWLAKAQKPEELVESAKEETAYRTRRMSEEAAETIERGSESAAERIEVESERAGEAVQEAGQTAAERTETAGEEAAEQTEDAGEEAGDDGGVSSGFSGG
jgi:uncharacterized protein HemX